MTMASGWSTLISLEWVVHNLPWAMVLAACPESQTPEATGKVRADRQMNARNVTTHLLREILDLHNSESSEGVCEHPRKANLWCSWETHTVRSIQRLPCPAPTLDFRVVLRELPTMGRKHALPCLVSVPLPSKFFSSQSKATIFADPLLIPGPEAIIPFPCTFLRSPLPFGAIVTSTATSPFCSQRVWKCF